MEATLPRHSHHNSVHRSSNERADSFALQRAIPIVCAVLMCTATLWNNVDINYEYAGNASASRVALDWPVAIKLVIAAACAVMGMIGAVVDPRVRGALFSGPGLILVLLAIVFACTAIIALPEVANVSRAASLIYIGYLMFIPTAFAVLGLRTIIIASLVGMVINLAMNWGLYLFVPELGIHEEFLGDEKFLSRMGGLGHPNAIARVGVLGGLLSLAMLRSRELAPRLPGGRVVLLAIIVLGVLTAGATFSRTAIVAGMVSAFLLLSDKVASREGMSLVFAGLVVLIGGLITFELVSGGGMLGDSLLSATTKTGTVEELTSATGRTDIWGEAIRLICERPITGWGLNSAPVMMENFSRHTHNLLLHATFCGGVFAGFLVLCLLLWNLFFGLTSDEPLVRAISMYVLVSGVFEDTVLDTFSSPSTLLWILVLLHPAMTVLSRKQPIEQEAEAPYNGPVTA